MRKNRTIYFFSIAITAILIGVGCLSAPCTHAQKKASSSFSGIVVDAGEVKPFEIVATVMEIHPESFKWKDPPYEYEHKKKPIDMIMGNSSLRLDLESGTRLSIIEEGWETDLEYFLQWRKPYLLYL